MPASRPAAPAEQQSIRAFVALPLPPAVKAALGGVVEALSPAWPSGAVRWVRPENMHLTLRFLGESPVAKLPDIAAALDAVGGQTAPFDLSLAALGSFPNRRRPQILWVGLRDGDGDLAPLKEGLDRCLQGLGWPAEQRPFRPHLTLGRIKGRARGRADWSAAVPPLDFAAGPLQLIESRLQPSGPVYTVLHRAPLAAEGTG